MENEKLPKVKNRAGPENSLEKFLISAAESLPSEKHPERNEDATINRPDLGLFAVFDGMGGHADGEKASGAARDAVVRHFVEFVQNRDTEAVRPDGWPNILKRAIEKAGEELEKLRAAYKKDLPDTTATIAKILEYQGKIYLAYVHAGDSRLYRRPAQGKIFKAVEQITEDGGILKYQWPNMPAGEREAIESALANATKDADLDQKTSAGVPLRYFFERRNFVNPSLAKIAADPKALQTGVLELDRGDLIFLTSDGIHDNLIEKEIGELAGQAKTPEEFTRKVLEATKVRSRMSKDENIRAKLDDMSVVAVEVR